MACKRQLGFHNEWSTGYNAGVWVQLPIVPDAPQCRLASGQPGHPDIVHLGRGVQQQPRRQPLWSLVAALGVRPRKTGSGQLVSVPSSVEKRKRKSASRDIEPQGGFPHVHDSFDQLRPAGSGAVAPARQPGPQRRPRDVPVHAGQGRPRSRRTHPDGSLVRAARPECRKIEAPGAGRSERPSEHFGAWTDGAIAERRQVGDTGGRQCQAQGRRTPDGQARRVQPAA